MNNVKVILSQNSMGLSFWMQLKKNLLVGLVSLVVEKTRFYHGEFHI